MIAIDISKQEELDDDLQAIQQIDLTRNLDKPGNTTIFFIIEESQKTILNFSQGIVKVFRISLYNLARAAKVFHRTTCFIICFTVT